MVHHITIMTIKQIKIVSCSSNKEKGRQEAIDSAQKITDRNVPLYAVGFKCSTDARNLMKNIAKTNKDNISDTEKINKYYSEPENGDDLNFVFENIADSIVSEADGEPINVQTTEGKMLIADGFEAGQNVEIYTGVYTKGTSTPKQHTLGTNSYHQTMYKKMKMEQ